MEAMEAIRTRRSIRKYTAQAVPDNLIKELLTAAMDAPSAGNEQPWHFIVLNDRGILDEIPNIHPYAAMIREAPIAVVICGDPSLEKHKDFWVQDCSAAAENFLLAAHAKGLGAVWCGIYPHMDRSDAFQKLLNLPNTIIPLALIPVGFPAESKPPANRFNPSRIHNNNW